MQPWPAWLLATFGMAIWTGAAHARRDAVQLDSEALTSCPGDCSSHGACIVDECDCDEGWSGDDCAYPIMGFVQSGILSIYPRSGVSLGGTTIRISGFNFEDTSDLACRFAPTDGTPIILPATYHNSSFVFCTSPPSAIVPLWSIAGDFSTYSSVTSQSYGRIVTKFPSVEMRAALHTPRAEYTVEVATHLPFFTDNSARFFQWGASLCVHELWTPPC